MPRDFSFVLFVLVYFLFGFQEYVLLFFSMLKGMVETSSINNLTCVFVCRAIHLQCTEAVQHCSDRVTWRSYFWRLTASLVHSLSLSPYVKFGVHKGINPSGLSSEKSLVVFTCWDRLQLQDCVAWTSLLNVCIKGLVVETVWFGIWSQGLVPWTANSNEGTNIIWALSHEFMQLGPNLGSHS